MFSDRMKELLAIKQPIINIKEEDEALALMLAYNELAENGIYKVFLFSASPLKGIQKMTVGVDNNVECETVYKDTSAKGVNTCFTEALEKGEPFAFIFRDFQYLTRNSQKTLPWERLLKDIIENPELPEMYFPIIMVSNNLEPSEELSYLIEEVEIELPNDNQRREYLLNYFNIKNKRNELKEETLDKLVKSFNGFKYSDIGNILNLMYVKFGKIDYNFILEKKIEMLKNTDLLDLKFPKVTLDEVGGNEKFKKWIKETEYCMSPEARKYGIPMPIGYLALGIPGSAKSFTAEALAASWNVPFVKMDFSKIMSRYVGRSERNMSKAMELVKSCAPCVCLIDEVEKCLGGYASSNNSDSGALARVFAIALDFLANNDNGVYVVMTSNDVAQLPPELTRSGRLDATWYFTLPTEKERKEIFDIHFKKRNMKIPESDLDYISKATENYTGAEIEQIVKSAIRKAFVKMKVAGNEDFSVSKDILEEAKKDVIPVAISSQEKIRALDEWAIRGGRALVANADDSKDTSLNFDDDSVGDIPAFKI